MVRVRARATLPIGRSTAFEQLCPFDAHLLEAPAVTAIDRVGDGGVGTAYHIELARVGQTGTLETTVTSVDTPARLDWEASRPITGSWNLHDRGTRSIIEVEIDLANTLLDRVELGRLLPASGVDALLRRLFRQEFVPVLSSLVEAGGGDPGELELLSVEIVDR